MGAVGFIILLVIAAVYGAAAQMFPGYPGRRTRFDGIIVFLVALLTGFIANLVRKGLGPQVDGLYYVPVAIIALFWSVIVTLLLRRVGRKEEPLTLRRD
jgi:hypothetical protein